MFLRDSNRCAVRVMLVCRLHLPVDYRLRRVFNCAPGPCSSVGGVPVSSSEPTSLASANSSENSGDIRHRYNYDDVVLTRDARIKITVACGAAIYKFTHTEKPPGRLCRFSNRLHVYATTIFMSGRTQWRGYQDVCKL